MPALFLLRRCQPSLQKSHQALAGMADWTISGSAERLREACTQIAAQAPDFVACDLRLLDGHADRLAQQLLQWPRRPQLLLLSPMPDEPRLFEALQGGASSYCIDGGDGLGLAAGLRQLADGRAAMSPAVARQILARFGLGRSSLAEALTRAAARDPAPMSRGLLRREQHLLSLLSHGLLSSEIAAHWGLEAAAIEQRHWRLYARLHALTTPIALAA